MKSLVFYSDAWNSIFVFNNNNSVEMDNGIVLDYDKDMLPLYVSVYNLVYLGEL